MKIAMIGSGYVGLVSGICFAEFGFDVISVDKDANKIARLQKNDIPIYEPGLARLLESNAKAGRIHFTTDLAAAIPQADVVFIGVGTPSRRSDGHADLTYVYEAAKEITPYLKTDALVVTKSTVPVGTGRKVKEIIAKTNPKLKFNIASNPEFLREGSAIDDFMRPNRIVCGVENEQSEKILSELYHPLSLSETPILFTDMETAELIKYASNSFLATKIAFINEISDLCEKVGANVQDVAKGMGLDQRIGNKFLHPSPGYGGSCFPKDTLALVKIAEMAEMPLSLVEAVVASNEGRKLRMVDKIEGGLKNVKGKRIAVLGLTFKPNTDDMRDSASLVILPELIKRGATIHAFDPQGMQEAKKLLPKEVTYASDAYDCMKNADAVVILTEWNEFRHLDMARMKSLLKQPLMIDLRNLYQPEEMRAANFTYLSLGRA